MKMIFYVILFCDGAGQISSIGALNDEENLEIL